MPWSSHDEVQFNAHLETTLACIHEAMTELGYGDLVIQAGEPRMLFQDDQASPFRPNPWFSWLVPSAPAAGSLLHIRPGAAPRLLFVAPADFWHSPPEVPDDDWTAAFSLQPLPDAAAAVVALQQTGRNSAWIGESPPPGEWDPNPAGLLARLEHARCHKTQHELACIRMATRIAATGHRAAENAFQNGASEFDIHLAFLAAVRQQEHELPYPPIIALNEHAATLHYQLRDVRPPARHLSLLIDAGAACHGYASDITRTWTMSPGIFASMVDAMHRLQQELCEAVAPGADWPELHLRAHHLVAALLRDAGILRLPAEDAVATGVSSAFLPHGLGHLLGLQVHDVGGLRTRPDADPSPRPPGHPALRLTRKLQAGMVVTVEPGLYFIDSLLAQLKSGPHSAAVNWTLVDNLRQWGGIRIEDNVAVTATGHENITRTAFADVA